MVNNRGKKPAQIQYTGVNSTGTKLTVSEHQRDAIRSSSRILGEVIPIKKRKPSFNIKQ